MYQQPNRMPQVYSKPQNSRPRKGLKVILFKKLEAIRIAENRKENQFRMLPYSESNIVIIPEDAMVSIPWMYSTVKWEDYVTGVTKFLYFNKGKVGDTIDMPPYVTLINGVIHICCFYHGSYYMVDCDSIPLETHQGFLEGWPPKKARWALDPREDDPDAGCYRRYVEGLTPGNKEEDSPGLNAPGSQEISSDYLDNVDWVLVSQPCLISVETGKSFW